MLPKEERLKKSSEFAYIYRRKRSVANSLLILYVGNKKRNESLPTRVGFVVGKKVSKKAVIRNRIKRQMREAYKELREVGLREYQNLIFIARPGIIESDYKQICGAIRDCAKKAQKRFK